MTDDLFLNIRLEESRSIQDQVFEYMVSLISAGHFAREKALPSSRRLAALLGISRNTVTLIYERLEDQGYLVPRARSGFYVNPALELAASEQFYPGQVNNALIPGDVYPPDWGSRFRYYPTDYRPIPKTSYWETYEYPFVHGQVESARFPMDQWRECGRKAMSRGNSQFWIADKCDQDDPLLVEHIRTKILPKRGVFAEPNQILITLGMQNALYMVANLLMATGVNVGIEDPGFYDARGIIRSFGAAMVPLPVDGEGVQVGPELASLDYMFVTPGHQVPTGVTMSEMRRRELLEAARAHSIVIIEDDYDAEFGLQEPVSPALKAMDVDGRVVYLGSLSKVLSPGIRMGYLVADACLVNELRALRRLMYRYVPLLSQRHLALFLSQGHYDQHLGRVRPQAREKRSLMGEAIAMYLAPKGVQLIGLGATAAWLKAGANCDTEVLAWHLARQSVLIEPGAPLFYHEDAAPRNFFRLGFSAIAPEKILPGVKMISQYLDDN